MKHLPAIRARCQQVWIVDGLKPIAQRTATIIVTGKQTWAEIYTRWGEPVRRRLGTKAFFTRKDAEVRKLGELRKIAANPYPFWHGAGRACDAARTQLKAFTETGVLH